MNGSDGTAASADVLAPAVGDLARHGWVAVADVHLSGRPEPAIERVLIGPGGVAVVETMSSVGPVAAGGGPCTVGEITGPAVKDTIGATAAVAARIPAEYRGIAFGVLCLTSQDQAASTARAGLHVVGRAQLASFLAGLPPRLSPFDVADVGRHLARTLAGPAFPTQTAGAAAYAEVSPSSGRPERSAHVPSSGRPVREPPSGGPGAPPEAAQTELRAPRRRPGRSVARVRTASGRLVLLLAAGILALVFALNAPALVDALGTLFNPTGRSSSAPS